MTAKSAGAIALLLLVILLAPVAVANGDDNGFALEPRDVEVAADDTEFRICSRGPDGDEIRVRFRADDARLELDFVPPGNETVELELDLRMEALVEFSDRNGDGFFNLTDPVVQELEVDDLPFLPPVLQPVDTGYRISVSYGLPNDGLSLGFVFHVVRVATEVDGVWVTPVEVKFDVLVEDFPYAEEDTLLALVMKLSTETEPQANFTGTEKEVLAVGEAFAAFFRWSGTAAVDGTPQPVRASVVKVETEQEGDELEVERTVVLAYGRGQRVLHDPSVGVTLAPPLPPIDLPDEVLPGLSLTAFGLMLAAAAAFVVATLALRRRQA